MHMNSDNTCPFCIYTSDTYKIKNSHSYKKKREKKPVNFPEKNLYSIIDAWTI